MSSHSDKFLFKNTFAASTHSSRVHPEKESDAFHNDTASEKRFRLWESKPLPRDPNASQILKNSAALPLPYNINDYLPKKSTSPKPVLRPSPLPSQPTREESFLSQMAREDLDSDSSSDEDCFLREEPSMFRQFLEQEEEKEKHKKNKQKKKEKNISSMAAVQEFIKKTVQEQIQKQQQIHQPIQISQPHADISTEQQLFGTPLHKEPSMILPVPHSGHATPHVLSPQYIPCATTCVQMTPSLECSHCFQHPVLSPRIPFARTVGHPGQILQHCEPLPREDERLDVRDLSRQLDLTANQTGDQSYVRQLENENSQLRQKVESLLCGDSQMRSRLVVREIEVQTDDLPPPPPSDPAALPPLVPHTRTNSDQQSQRFTTRQNPILTPRSESPYYLQTDMRDVASQHAFNFTVRMNSPPVRGSDATTFVNKEVSSYEIQPEGTAEFPGNAKQEPIRQDFYTPESVSSAIHVPSRKLYQSQTNSTPYRYQAENQIESLTVSLEPSLVKEVVRIESAPEVTPTSTQLKRQAKTFMARLSDSSSSNYTPDTSYILSEIPSIRKTRRLRNSSFLDKVKLIQRSVRDWLKMKKEEQPQVNVVALSEPTSGCDMSSASSTNRIEIYSQKPSDLMSSCVQSQANEVSSNLLQTINMIRNFKSQFRAKTDKLNEERVSVDLSVFQTSKENLAPSSLLNTRLPLAATSPASSALLSDDTSVFRSGLTPQPLREVTQGESILSAVMEEKYGGGGGGGGKSLLQYSPESMRHTLSISSQGGPN